MARDFLVFLLLAICREALSQDDSCSYTFQVSKSQMGQMCSRSVETNEDIENLKRKVEILEQIVQTQQRKKELSEFEDKLDEQRGLLNDAAYSDDSANIPDEETEFNLRGASSSKRRGVNYVRYGHRGCASPARLIYDGYLGKSFYTHGGGSNYLCLPRKPEWLETNKAGFQSHSYIYGVEYELSSSQGVAPSASHDQDVPCAVCEVLGRSQKLMIPAKTSCPIGWKQEYQGILMSERYSHKSADFVCVDMAFQSIHGGAGSKNGGLLYVVEAKCGSLPCPPYNDGNEIACIVCTK